MRNVSKVAPGWWDYTTLDKELLDRAAALTEAEKVSIWHPGHHDNPFGMRLTTLMISEGVADSSVPMSLLADHPNVQFNFLRPALGACQVEMH